MEKENESRRDFITRFAPMTFWGSVVVWTGSLARFTLPTLLPQETKKLKIGLPADFPSGTVKTFEEERVVLFSDDKGLFAISTTCTHLGCVVKWTGTGFDCPCHGSVFNVDGDIKKGPAPKGLNWHKIDQLPSGQLAIDLSSFVRAGTKETFYV
jgi:cytochrome b6-f complex iron-sulfur subunit